MIFSVYVLYWVSLWSLCKANLTSPFASSVEGYCHCWAQSCNELKLYNRYRKLSSVISEYAYPIHQVNTRVPWTGYSGVDTSFEACSDSTKITLIIYRIDHIWYVFAWSFQQGNKEVVFVSDFKPTPASSESYVQAEVLPISSGSSECFQNVFPWN